MKIELRRFKDYPRLSDETVAFNADLYIDGKKRGGVENDGHGGANFFTDRAAEREVEAFAKTLPDDPSQYGPIAMNDDYLISKMIDELMAERDVVKLVKKMVKVAARVGASHILIASKPGLLQGYATSHPDLTSDKALEDGFASVRRFTAAGVEQ